MLLSATCFVQYSPVPHKPLKLGVDSGLKGPPRKVATCLARHIPPQLFVEEPLLYGAKLRKPDLLLKLSARAKTDRPPAELGLAKEVFIVALDEGDERTFLRLDHICLRDDPESALAVGVAPVHELIDRPGLGVTYRQQKLSCLLTSASGHTEEDQGVVLAEVPLRDG